MSSANTRFSSQSFRHADAELPRRHNGASSWRRNTRRRPFDALTALLLLPISVAAAAGIRPEVVDLAQQQTGAPPQRFAFRRAGEADAGSWSIAREATGSGAASIQQSGPNRAASPTLAIYASPMTANVKVRLRFKLIGGALPNAGVALRVDGPDNYDLVRVDASEGRLSFIHVTHGHPEEIAGVDADIARDHWQTLEVTAFGDGFKILLDDRWVLTAFDHDAFAGDRFALWSEKDTVARFGQIEITPLAAKHVGLVGG